VPWKETCAMDERKIFIEDWLRGEYTMAELCRQYEITRKTGYKWVARFLEHGYGGLEDLSRAPKNHPNAVSDEIEKLVVGARGDHPTWGPKKLKIVLEEMYPGLRIPSESTIGAILKRHGLTVPRRRRRHCEPSSQPFAECDGPNSVWCADFKGWFRTGDGLRVDPLTISDAYSRYLIRCQGMRPVTVEGVQRIFEAAFREFGMPLRIRTDNGSPFAATGLGGLSRLSVWWIRLGITPERIEPGKPYQNGRHERMHLTLKQETANPPARNLRAQQRVFDAFQNELNNERPHEAIGLIPPAALYELSPRIYPGRLPPIRYPETMVTRKVQKRGEIRWGGSNVFISKTLAGEILGLEPIDDRYFNIYLAWMQIGRFDSHRLVVLRNSRKSS